VFLPRNAIERRGVYIDSDCLLSSLFARIPVPRRKFSIYKMLAHHYKLEMWANDQRDGRPAEYRCSTPQSLADTRVPRSNAAKTRNRLKFTGVPQTNETISAACGPKFTILWGHVEEVLLFSFFRLSIHALVAKI